MSFAVRMGSFKRLNVPVGGGDEGPGEFLVRPWIAAPSVGQHVFTYDADDLRAMTRRGNPSLLAEMGGVQVRPFHRPVCLTCLDVRMSHRVWQLPCDPT